MRKIFVAALMINACLFFVNLCYAQFEFAESSSDGIYKIGSVTIKIFPPKGWRIVKQDLSKSDNTIQFVAPTSKATSLGITVIPFSDFPETSETEIFERIVKETDKETNVLEKNVINFLDIKALSLIKKLNGIKLKHIQFFKNGNMFILSFVSGGNSFDILLPEVDKSFDTFTIIN